MCFQMTHGQIYFKEKPEVFTREAKREWLDKLTGVALGSDAFFPFGDNIERATQEWCYIYCTAWWFCKR